MENKVNILGVNIDKYDFSECLQIVLDFLKQDKPKTVFTPNAEIVMKAVSDPEFMSVLNSGDLVVADGVGVLLASKIKGCPVPDRVSGVDLAWSLFGELPYHTRIFLYGGQPGVAPEAAQKITQRFSGIKIVGTSHGYVTCQETLIEQINAARPDVLFVCLGAPLQEMWIAKNMSRIEGCKLFMGLGGSLDVFSGNVKRAPLFFQRAGLEWLYRLIKQPQRIGRMLTLPKFLFLVLFGGKK